MSQNKVQPWMRDAVAEIIRKASPTFYSSFQENCERWPEQGIEDEDMIRIIAAHAPASAPLSALEREVKEKWDAVHDGKCKCTEFVLCDACRSNHSLCTFVQLNSYRIAEALVKRLPKENQ